MPRSYKRKTGRASTPLEDMDRTVKEVEKGKSIRQVVRHMPPAHAHATGLEAGPDPGEPPTLPEPNPEQSSSDKAGSSAHLGYVSPEAILPLPKATARKLRMRRKKVKSKIMINTPEKMELEKAQKEKEDKIAEKKKNERQKKRALKESNQTKLMKKTVVYSSSEESTMDIPLDDTTEDDEAEDGLENTHGRENERGEKEKRNENKKRGALKGSKPTKPKKKVIVSSSSEESDISIPLNDTTDYESSDVQNDDDGDKDLSAGDFVTVNFAGKTKSYNYVGLVEKVDGADINAKFLRRCSKRSVDGKPIFIFKENDERVIPREDVHKKLPTPQKLGGTARREQKCIFPCSIDKWDVT